MSDTSPDTVADAVAVTGTSTDDASDTSAGTGRDGGATGGRLAVAKTYKLFIGGAFPRSESGRSYPVSGADGRFLANAAQASRKDARDAVAAARKAFPGWSGATAYNRGQVLYRVAEVLEGRRAQFAAELAAGGGTGDVEAEVDAAIDRWVWYAGWSDKVATVLGAANPVAGPYFSFTVPEPTGVVAILAPPSAALLGLVSVLAPVICTGNTAVLVAAQERPLPAITLSEVLATADLPGGVVNVLTGRTAELAPWLATHAEVNALDLTGAPPAMRADLERAAAGTVKRVLRARAEHDGAGEPDWTAEPDLRRLRAFLEAKTVWHPTGA
jgi:acyl-CoA reductase-like NAD-dependent aldehyde dehydrogenase